MTFTAEQKSQLARLMATENLTVQHQKIQTAKFDPKNRVLYLPIWQNMTGAIYDLLCGHEVGHALYTPADGWHNTASDKSKGKFYKNFLNVVEDARIEKKVKRKYPGLNNSFRNGYQELINRDFFGIKNNDVNELSFIDRLNLYSKSQWTNTKIEFSAKEELLVKKVQACESWDDVVRATDEVYAYSKEEQMEMKLQYFEELEAAEGDDFNNEIDSDYEFDEYDDEENSAETTEGQKNQNGQSEESDEENDGDGNGEKTDKESNNKSDDNKGEKSGENDSGEETDSDENGDSYNRWKESQSSWQDQFSPSCSTDESFRNNETMLLDEKCKEFCYVNMAKPIMKNIVTPAKTVQANLTKFYGDCATKKYIQPGLAMELVNDFKRKNERYIGLLAKEFEMRKAAKAFSKSKLADTGDIDINKLSSYKFDDNIFRKVMLTPKGKSHGLILLLDKSGSMSNNMSGSIEQILVLAMFCRKVNIPFAVYGFGDSEEARICDLNMTVEQHKEYVKTSRDSFTKELGSVELGTVFLREYINSQMSNAEFTGALKNMLLLKKAFEVSRLYRSYVPLPDSEYLSNTPLTQALVATAEVMKQFKQKNNLDLTSLIIVHDGDADWINRFHTTYDVVQHDGQTVTKHSTERMEFNNKNVYLVDRENKFQIKLDGNRQSVSVAMFKWFAKVTNSKIFGFFIVSNQSPAHTRQAINNRYSIGENETLSDLHNRDYHQWHNKQKELVKQFKDEKFLISKNDGYNSFFLISGGNDLKTEQDEIEIEGKFTAKKLASAFAKMNKKKTVNRVLVSKFIEGIAA
jgi:hypothetical protein